MEPPKDPQNCTRQAWGIRCLQAASGNFSTKGIAEEQLKAADPSKHNTILSSGSTSRTNLVTRRGELVDAPRQLRVRDGLHEKQRLQSETGAGRVEMMRQWGARGRGRAFFFLFRWGRTLTGLSALAAEMVSFWICVSVPFFDLRSAVDATGFPSREPTPPLPPPPPPEDSCCDDAPAPEAADGSEVMRSISVVPDESCPEAMAAGQGAAGVGDLRRARGLSVSWDFSGRVGWCSEEMMQIAGRWIQPPNWIGWPHRGPGPTAPVLREPSPVAARSQPRLPSGPFQAH